MKSTMEKIDKQHLYFIHCITTNSIKIGISNNPEKRLRNLQLGCPTKLTLFAVVPFIGSFEFQLHEMFENERLHGEWFVATSEIKNTVKDMVNTFYESGDTQSILNHRYASYNSLFESKNTVPKKLVMPTPEELGHVEVKHAAR